MLAAVLLSVAPFAVHGTPNGHGGGTARAADSPLHLLVGTLVGADTTRGAEGLTLTFLPDSTVATTDRDGDFILDWSGAEGILVVESSSPAACMRIPVPHSDEDELDLGRLIRPRPRISGTPTLDFGLHPPDAIPSTATDAPARSWFLMQATFDVRGNILEVARTSDDPPPRELWDAAADWMRNAPWRTPPRARCEDPAFEVILPIAYLWNADAHRWDRDPDNRPR
ncbi:MAG: hypothetical protein R3E12_07375 [Candidatus Eisenbacteria bacterium]|uniref:Uncharacterized protein n=1 Tax=Eiseniibacteriota bacterium TaxID=2212470 RepID=A0A956RPQ5_UNCEI|nr:hypothetical protein [Candidatus Eisenbacteria bacterium]